EVSAPSPSPGDGDGGVAGPPPPPDDRIAGLEHGRGRGPLADRRPGAGPAHLALLPVAAARPVRRPVPVPGGAGPPGNPPGRGDRPGPPAHRWPGRPPRGRGDLRGDPSGSRGPAPERHSRLPDPQPGPGRRLAALGNHPRVPPTHGQARLLGSGRQQPLLWGPRLVRAGRPREEAGGERPAPPLWRSPPAREPPPADR